MSAQRISFISAPVFLFMYGACYVLDGLRGVHGPGAFWTLGHIFFVLAFISFTLVAWKLKALAGEGAAGRFALIAALLVIIGIAVFLRVGGIDLATGILARDHAGMAPISLRLNSWPDARLLPFWRLGPIFFQLGLMSLLALLAFLRRLPWWSPVVILIGFAVIAYNLNLLVVGATLIGIGLRPAHRTA